MQDVAQRHFSRFLRGCVLPSGAKQDSGDSKITQIQIRSIERVCSAGKRSIVEEIKFTGCTIGNRKSTIVIVLGIHSEYTLQSRSWKSLPLSGPRGPQGAKRLKYKNLIPTVHPLHIPLCVMGLEHCLAPP